MPIPAVCAAAEKTGAVRLKWVSSLATCLSLCLCSCTIERAGLAPFGAPGEPLDTDAQSSNPPGEPLPGSEETPGSEPAPSDVNEEPQDTDSLPGADDAGARAADGGDFDAEDASRPGSDLCPDDDSKVAPGMCGCGLPESDRDSDDDGTLDCRDACPRDAKKTTAGDCGCGQDEPNKDGDAAADCIDECPRDAEKITRGLCGCGKSDVDDDGDGTPNCLESGHPKPGRGR